MSLGDLREKKCFQCHFSLLRNLKTEGIKNCQFHSIVQVDNNFYFLCLLDHRKDVIMYNIQTLQ